MRLLFVSHSFPPENEPTSNLGGMQRVATDLYRALQDVSDIDLSAHVLRTSWAATHRRIPRFLFSSYRRIRAAISAGEVDAVLFSSMVTATLSILLYKRARNNGVLLGAIVHGLDVTTPVAVYQWIVRKVFKRIDVVFPVSSATGAACTARGLDRARVEVVPNGISGNRFTERENHENYRSRLLDATGLVDRPDSFLLCSVGRHVKRKGFDWFISSVLPRLNESTHYLLAGEGPMTEEIRAAADNAGVSDRVHFLGRVSESELEMLYGGSDIFVMPNIQVPGDMEGFGVVMLEAGLLGLPVVAANIEGIADVIEPGGNGVLLPSEEPKGFIETIQSFQRDRQALNMLRSTARSSVLDRFEWGNVARFYVDKIRSRMTRPV